jgi:thermolabile hemolysin
MTAPRPTARRAALFLTLTLAAAAMPTAGAMPFGQENATLRCQYERLGQPPAAPAGEVDVQRPIRGAWQHARLLSWNNLFRTRATPEALAAACRERLRSVVDAKRLVAVRAAGALGPMRFSYPIWHEGDLRPGQPIERIVSFGDSLSDTGNMFNASQTVLKHLPVGATLPSASWFAGRFSNGPTWVEHLAMRTGLTVTNWAVGGAQTRDAQFGLIHGIGRQIESFFQHMDEVPGYDPSRTLFTFLVAGNDFVNDSKQPADIVRQQRESLMALLRHGARNILIVNLPNVTAAPVFRLGRTDAAAVLNRVNVYNSALASMASGVTRQAVAEGLITHASEAMVRVVDARSRFDALLAAPERYGFDNVTDSCLRIDRDSSLGYLSEQVPRKHCVPDRFVFWDTLHPTTRVHELMAQWALEAAPATWNLR